jgi:hypothetical protein
VPGEGPNRAVFMLVGEPPGDKEDIADKHAAHEKFVADLRHAAAAIADQ